MIDFQAPFKIIILSLQWLAFLLLVSRSSNAITPIYRLPEDVVPEHYDINILTNLDEKDFSFHGRVSIRIKCLRSTKKIALHVYTLTVDTDTLKLYEIDPAVDSEPQRSSPSIKITKSSYDYINEFFTVETEKALEPNRTYIYDIPYSGILNTNLFGFYRSSYRDQSTNQTRWLAVTQFSPIHARKAFPCFDEPGMKATFSISLIHKESLTALSNMPVKSMSALEDRSGWTVTEFEKTVRMSTYLVGFMVSDFKHLPPTKTEESGIPFRVWAREDALDQTKYARYIGPALLAFLEKYFGINYPLPKQDIAAIPDFHFRAMENWGLITFRELAILYNPNSTSVNTQQSLTFTAAHEIAHQWFGNLVTMQWWTDLWLKEGFASYLGAIAMESVLSQWKTMNYRVAADLMSTFSLDSLNSSHPVSVPIGNPNEVAQLFDKIPYAKGPLIIRMANHFLGDEAFKEGLTNYLHRYAYGNAEKDDLWDELTTVAHRKGVLPAETTVKCIMDTWTVQTGYPLVKVERDYNKGTAEVSQSRYLQSIQQRSELSQKPCWWIPLSYTTRENPDFESTKPKAWLNCSGPVTVSNLPDDNNWILFNIKATGTFRVNYDVQNWKLLTKTLKNERNFTTIDPLNRMLLVADSFGLARTGDMTYELTIDLVTYLKHEPEFIVWETAVNQLSYISRMLRATSDHEIFKNYVRGILKPVYERLGPLTDDPKDSEASRLKSLITSLAVQYRLGVFEEEVVDLFQQMISPGRNVVHIPKDIRRSIYCAGIALSRKKEWEILWNRYVESNIPDEKEDILAALGCSKDEATRSAYLGMSIEENSPIRRQDTILVFNSVAADEIGYRVAKSFFIQRCPDIYNFFGAKTTKMGDYLSQFSSFIRTEEELKEFDVVIAKNAEIFEYSKLAKNQFYETVKINIDWFKTNQHSIGAILQAFTKHNVH